MRREGREKASGGRLDDLLDEAAHMADVSRRPRHVCFEWTATAGDCCCRQLPGRDPRSRATSVTGGDVRR